MSLNAIDLMEGLTVEQWATSGETVEDAEILKLPITIVTVATTVGFLATTSATSAPESLLLLLGIPVYTSIET